MVAARSVVLVKFVPTLTSTTMMIRTLDSLATRTRLFGCYSLIY
jgi:hypothetical protein